MQLCFRPYQKEMREHGIKHPYCGLLAEMGLGKTPVTLSLIDYFMYWDVSVMKTLIIAPLNVAESVWTDEAEKWEDFHHLRIVKVLGTRNQRLEALREKADVYVINVDNVAWLVNHYLTAWPFDMVVIDESSMFKSSDSQRFRHLRMVRPHMDRVVILTGTPTPNGLVDLWSQMYLLDMGERLGKSVSEYQHEYLFPDKVGRHKVNKWGVTPDNTERVLKKIEDICISLKEKDYIKLPPIMYQDHKVKLSPADKKKYEEFERTQVLKFFDQDPHLITAVNAGVLTNKLIQFAGGSIYDSEKESVHIHDAKLDLIEEIIEAANGEPVLIAYEYVHQLEKMQKKFGGHLFKKEDVKAWNEKKYPIMYVHPKSGGHGLNLQMGGCILVWFSPTWSLEHWLQMNKRLHRPGQDRPVMIHRVLAVGTMDIDCVRSVDKKENVQDGVMNALKIRYNQYKRAA